MGTKNTLKKQRAADRKQHDLKQRKTCAKKIVYAADTAEKSAEWLAKRYRQPMKAYECPVCGQWHVTHDYTK